MKSTTSASKTCDTRSSESQHVQETKFGKLSTAEVVPQGQADKDKAPSSRSGGSPRQEQEGSGQQSHRVPYIFILFVSTLCPFSEGVPKQDPNPKQIRTERALAESRVVLI